VVCDVGGFHEYDQPRGALRGRRIDALAAARGRERVREREAERVAHLVPAGRDVLAQQKARFGGRRRTSARDRADDLRGDDVEVRGPVFLQGAIIMRGCSPSGTRRWWRWSSGWAP